MANYKLVQECKIGIHISSSIEMGKKVKLKFDT
jgi:hypothetical protein